MNKVIAYLLIMLVLFITLLILRYTFSTLGFVAGLGEYIPCALIGGLAGCIYCLRGVYRAASVLNNWDDRWIIWYVLRPIVSTMSGAIACLFLKAGLLLLESKENTEATGLAMYAIAFIAGYNVDSFMKRIEESVKSLCGIEPSGSNRK